MDLIADQLKGILDSAIAAISHFRFFPDQSWKVLYWSAGTEHILGFTAADLMVDEQLWPSRIPAEDWQGKILPAFQTIASQPIRAFEYRFRHRDGSMRWIAASQRASWDEPTQSWLVTTVAHDISERKQQDAEYNRIEVQLCQSENLLQAAQQVAHLGSWKFDLTTQKITWSEELFRLFGLDPNQPEPDYATYLQLLHPDDVLLLQQSVNRAIQAGIPYKIELRHFHPDGSCRYHEGRGEPIFNPEGRVIRLIGTAVDITDRKQLELALQASEKRYRSLIENLPGAVFRDVWIDNHWTAGYINDFVTNICGYEANDFIHDQVRSWMSIIHPEDQAHLQHRIDQSLDQQGTYSLEYRIIHADGSTRWVLERGREITGSKDQLRSIDGVIFDISDRKNAEIALQTSEQKFRAIFENALDAILIADDQGEHYLDVNPAACKLFGLSREELLQARFADFFGSGFSFSQVWQSFLETGEMSGEMSLYLPKGLVKQVEFAAKANFLPHRHLSILRDISDRKAAELALQESEERRRLALELTETGNWEFDVATGDAIWSDSHYRLMGLVPGELPSNYQTWRDRVHPDDLVATEAAFNQSLVTHTLLDVEYRVVYPNGTVRWVLTKGQGIYDASGQALRMLGVMMDISDRKAAELALQQLNEELEQRVQQRTQELARSEQDLRTIFNNVYDAIFIHDLDGTILDVNNRAMALFAAQRDQLIGIQVYDLCAPDFPPEVFARNLQRAQAGETLQFEGYGRRFDNSTTFKTETSVRLASLSDRPVLISGVRDISDHKAAEAELRASQARLRATFEQAAVGILQVSLEGRFIQVNQKLCEIVGYTASQLLNKTYADITHAEDVEISHEQVRRLLAGDQSACILEKRYIRKDGEIVWANVSVSLVYGSAGQPDYLIAVIQDITERVRLEQERNQSQQRLRAESLRLQLALEAAEMGTWECCLKTGEIFWSEPVEAMFGFAPGTFPRDREAFIERLYPADRDRVLAAITHTFATQTPYSIEYRIQRPDGNLRWLAAWGKVISLDSGLRMVGVAADITDRKQAEADLLKSQALLIEAQRMARMGNWEFNPITREIYWTEEVYRLFNLDPSQPEPSYAELASLYHPEDWAVLQVAMEQAITTREPYKLILRTAPSGPESSVRYLETIGQVERNSLGQVVRLYGTCQDITDRRLSELALQESEERFRQLAESITQVFWLANADLGELLYVSPAYEQVWGYSLASLHESPSQWFECILAEDQEGVSQAMLLLTQGNYQMEYRILRADGQLRWIRDRAFPVYNEAGDVYRIAGIAEDITERKQAELALAENNIILQSVIDSTPDVVFVKDLQGRTVIVNDAFADFFNRPKAELLGKADAELWPIEMVTHIREIDSRIMALGRAETFEEPLLAPEGVRTYLMTKFPWRNSHGHIIGLIGMARDITERKQAEEQIQASLRQKELLLREIHHRIKNNLQVVSSLLMLQADTTDDPYTQKVLQDSQERVAAIALVHEALYRSADLERIDLSEYIQDLLEQIFYSYQGSERGILLQLELEPIWLNLETVLPCALILNELLVNALKHGFPDQRSGQISVSLNHNEEMITLSVADDGIGLPPDLDCRQSSSLGLQLVHTLTEQLDGSLTIASAQSHPQGTCFTIRFQELFYCRRV